MGFTTVAAAMASVGAVAKLPAGLGEKLDYHAIIQRYERGDKLYMQGESADEIMLVTAGRAKVTVASNNGREVLVQVVGPSSLIGECALIAGADRASSAYALSRNVEVAAIDQRALAQLIIDEPAFNSFLLEAVAKKVQVAEFRQLELATDDVQGRVIRRILELADMVGYERDGHLHITSPLTQQELAEWAGVSRQAVVKELKMLREEGVLESKGKSFVLIDLQALAERAAKFAAILGPPHRRASLGASP